MQQAIEELVKKHTIGQVRANPPPWPIDVIIPWCGLPETDHCRYTEDLKYNLRSVCTNIPWIRRIFLIVQDDFQKPFWMRNDYDKDRLVIIKTQSFVPLKYLPTYNWHVLQSWVWKIKSLAEHFILLHDDMYIGSPTPWTCFFTQDGKPINRHYPGPIDHAIHVDHRIPYVRMWNNAILKHKIHNTRIQQQATPYRKKYVVKYFKQFEKEIKQASQMRHISGEHDFDLLRFTTALTSSSNGKEAIVVRTNDYDWRLHKAYKAVVDYFVEADDVQGIRNIAKKRPRFFIINNSSSIYSHIRALQQKLFDKPSPFEYKT